MLQLTKRFTKRIVLAVAMVAAGGLALGSAGEAEARGCGPYGYGYGGGYYGGGFGPRAVVVSRPVVVAPRGFGYGYGYGRNVGYYGAGYRGFYGPRGGVSIGFGF